MKTNSIKIRLLSFDPNDKTNGYTKPGDWDGGVGFQWVTVNWSGKLSGDFELLSFTSKDGKELDPERIKRLNFIDMIRQIIRHKTNPSLYPPHQSSRKSWDKAMLAVGARDPGVIPKHLDLGFLNLGVEEVP